jgi:hypothetical protein
MCHGNDERKVYSELCSFVAEEIEWLAAATAKHLRPEGAGGHGRLGVMAG